MEHRPENNPINHHYVPQHVLRRFCDPHGFLWTYDKQTKRIVRGYPKSQASKEHFYSFESNAGKDSKTIELAFLGKIDNDGSVAIASLLRREVLTPEQARAFMRFAAAQMVRVETYFDRLTNMFSPTFQEMAERMVRYDDGFRTGLVASLRKTGTKDEEDEIKQFITSLEQGKFKVAASRDFVVTAFLNVVDQITAEFCKMDWCFLRTHNTKDVFVISDNPLVLEDVGKSDAQPLGILNRDIEITLPLDPTTVAIGRWNEKTSYGTVATESIAVINQRTIDQAQRYVYAPYRSEELLANVVVSQGRQAQTRVKKIKVGNSTILLSTYSK